MNNTQENTLDKIAAQAKANFPADYRAGSIAQWNLDNLDIQNERLARLNDQVESQGENSLSPEDMAFWLGCLVNDLPAPVCGVFKMPSL